MGSQGSATRFLNKAESLKEESGRLPQEIERGKKEIEQAASPEGLPAGVPPSEEEAYSQGETYRRY